MVIIECKNRFWDGQGWTEQFQNALQFSEPVEAVLCADRLISELSAEELPGEYICVYQDYYDPENEVLLSSISKD